MLHVSKLSAQTDPKVQLQDRTTALVSAVPISSLTDREFWSCLGLLTPAGPPCLSDPLVPLRPIAGTAFYFLMHHSAGK